MSTASDPVQLRDEPYDLPRHPSGRFHSESLGQSARELRARVAEPARDAPPVIAETMLEGILFATSGTSIIATDVDGTIIFVNRGAEEMLGYTAHELIGETPARFHDLEELQLRSGAVPGTHAEVMDALGEVILGAPAGERADWTYYRKDGQKLTVSLGVSAIKDIDGGTLGYVGIAEDVSEIRRGQRLLEEALLKEADAVRRLDAVEHAKNHFIATVGHELRTPLSGMLGYTELLKDGQGGPLSDEQTQLLMRVESNGQRLANLVEQFITLAQMECESFPVSDQEVNLNLVVESALAGVSPPFERSELKVEVHLDPVAPLVNGTAEELERVVVHLLSNAAIHNPAGGRVVVSTHHSDLDGFIVVADSGVGIPSADQEELFAPFCRSSISTKRAIQGSGLGLSIVETIVNAHNGDISVSSEEGHGAAFIVRLPSAWGGVGDPGGPRLALANISGA